MNDSETHRKGNFKELKSKKFLEGACPRTPLEAYPFDARLGNSSVFILDPRLYQVIPWKLVYESLNWGN